MIYFRIFVLLGYYLCGDVLIFLGGWIVLCMYICGELRVEDKDKVVIICGWVDILCDLGFVKFIDVWDWYGVI